MSELTDRKKRILKAIVDEYIETAEPVGSKILVEKYQLGVSSATLRNEMADLEDMGYLMQLHTSSGRVPSNNGYRFYVDQLMKEQTLSESEVRRISSAFDSRLHELDRLIAEAGRAISEMTNYASVTLTPRITGDVIRSIRLFPCEPNLYVFVIISESGLVNDKMIRTSRPMKESDVNSLADALNRILRGLAPGDISFRHMAELESAAGEAKELLYAILDYIKTIIAEYSSEEVHIDGANKLLYYPEFHDLDKARSMFDFLGSVNDGSWIARDEDGERKPGEQGLVKIRIGSENGIAPLNDSSFVVTDIQLSPNSRIYLGLLGPTRMDYARASARLQFVARILGRVIEDIMGNNEE
ncbi:MAG: heat-inducible transcriptional repressor HrcA [Clostridia bacterium]|nr:heat-inducible transcriptional repressor HrcA [Clostridia bacterium]